MTDRLCPECGDKLHARAVACACGWRQTKATKQATQQFDTQCAWMDHGVRCGYQGSIGDSVLGGGQWYCSLHWDKLRDLLARNPQAQPMSYRERWYAEQGRPYEDAKLGDMPPFRCIGQVAEGLAKRGKKAA